MAVLSFLALYLHDERGLDKGEAAAVVGVVQVGAIVLRIGAGRWSDLVGSRIGPLQRIGLAMTATLGLATVLLDAPLRVLLVPRSWLAGALTMAWNGVAFAAVAELAGRARSGAALGMQQSVLSCRRASRPDRVRGRGAPPAPGASPTGSRRFSRSAAGSCFARYASRRRRASAPPEVRSAMRVVERLEEFSAIGDRIGYSAEEQPRTTSRQVRSARPGSSSRSTPVGI